MYSGMDPVHHFGKGYLQIVKVCDLFDFACRYLKICWKREKLHYRACGVESGGKFKLRDTVPNGTKIFRLTEKSDLTI